MRDGWREVRLGEILALDLEAVAVEPEAEYRLAGVFSFGRGLFARDPLRGSKTSYKQLNRLRAGQLVMSKLKAWEGAVAVVDDAFDGYVLSPEFPTFSITGDLDERYLSLVCSRPSFWDQLQIESRGMGGRRERVHPRRLLDVALLLPPIEEQRRMVDLVGAVEQVGRTSKRVADRSWELVGAVLDDHEQSLSEASVPIESLLQGSIGGVWGDEPGAGEVDVTVYRSTDFTSNGVLSGAGARRSISMRQMASRELRAGDILLEKSGGGPKQPVGRVVWVAPGLDRSVCANFVQLMRPDAEKVDPRYLFLRLWNFHRSGRTLEIQTQTTGIRNLRTKEYLSTPIALPNRRTQQAVAAGVDAAMDVANSARVAARSASDLLAALTTAVLSGDSEIPDSYDMFLEQVS